MIIPWIPKHKRKSTFFYLAGVIALYLLLLLLIHFLSFVGILN